MQSPLAPISADSEGYLLFQEFLYGTDELKSKGLEYECVVVVMDEILRQEDGRFRDIIERLT